MRTDERRMSPLDAVPQEREPSGGSRRGGLRRALLVAVIALGLVGVGSVGLFLRTGPGHDAPAAGGTDGQALISNVSIPKDALVATIARLQSALRADPKNAGSWAYLGFAYVQAARVSADPTYYPKADGALRRSLALQPDANADADAGMGSLAAARHDFAAALSWAEKAKAINPYNATIHAIIGDALIELGRYPQAFAEFQRMIDIRPDVSTYARVSYAQELQGAIPAAAHSMQMAYQAAGTAADAAWASYYLGELAWNQGDLDGAERDYLQGTRIDQMFVPNYEGLAKVEAARGQTAAALKDYASVTSRYPLPQYVLEYGDLATSAGQQLVADQQYALFHAEVQLFGANGVGTNLETALFDADHGTDLSAGLAAARAEWQARQSINVADALAWELYANGQPGQALPFAKKAIALGTENAAFFFHKGLIERALGQRAAARRDLAKALQINPSFSFLWASRARAALSQLGGAP